MMADEIMKLYELREGGAVYWIAANNEVDAKRVWKYLAEECGTMPDSLEAFEGVRELTGDEAARVRLWTDDTGRNTEPMLDAVGRCTVAEVLSCSEWP